MFVEYVHCAHKGGCVILKTQGRSPFGKIFLKIFKKYVRIFLSTGIHMDTYIEGSFDMHAALQKSREKEASPMFLM